MDLSGTGKFLHLNKNRKSLLGISRATIYRHMAAGIIRALQLRGRTIIRKSDIEKMFARVELFARQSPPGRDVWGNEVEPTIPDFWTKCPEEAGQKEVL